MYMGLNLILVMTIVLEDNSYHNQIAFLKKLGLIMVQIIAWDNKQAQNQIIVSANNGGPPWTTHTGACVLRQ